MKDRQRIVPELGEFTPKDGAVYRPSNGTEGEYFFAGWCNNCKRDRAHQDSGGEAEGCPIIAASMCYDSKDPKYPKQWIWKEGEPVCTEFDDVDDRITTQERAANLELPLA